MTIIESNDKITLVFIEVSTDDKKLSGIGHRILNGAKIGNNSIVGAGSLVTQSKEYE